MNQREGFKKFFGIDEEEMTRIEKNRQKRERRKERSLEITTYIFAGITAAMIALAIRGCAG